MWLYCIKGATSVFCDWEMSSSFICMKLNCSLILSMPYISTVLDMSYFPISEKCKYSVKKRACKYEKIPVSKKGEDIENSASVEVESTGHASPSKQAKLAKNMENVELSIDNDRNSDKESATIAKKENMEVEERTMPEEGSRNKDQPEKSVLCEAQVQDTEEKEILALKSMKAKKVTIVDDVEIINKDSPTLLSTSGNEGEKIKPVRGKKASGRQKHQKSIHISQLDANETKPECKQQ